MEATSLSNGFDTADREFDEDDVCRSTVSLFSSLPSANLFFKTLLVSTVPSGRVRRSVVVIVETIESFLPSSSPRRDQDDVDDEEDIMLGWVSDSSKLVE